ncbi:MAG: tetratricopeptide repeat protein [Nitrospiraceae bacterium]
MTTRSEKRRWVRVVWYLAGASSLFVLGCTGSSDPAARWEKDSAKASEAFQQGRYAEAETLWESALKDAESFQPEDPRLVVSLKNLAQLYDDQKKYADAEPLYQRLLAIDEKTLGPDHPDVATILYRLAKLYQARGKYAEAEPLYQRALAIREGVLGPTHPDVIMILESYAALLRDTNRTDDTARLIEARIKASRGKATLEICPN